MGFMDFKFEHNYDNCLKQAEWCARLYVEAFRQNHPQDVLDCIWNLVQIWEKKAEVIRNDSQSKNREP